MTNAKYKLTFYIKSPQTPFKMGVNGQLIFCLNPARILAISQNNSQLGKKLFLILGATSGTWVNS